MFNNAVYDRSDTVVYFDSFKTNFGQTTVHHDKKNSDMVNIYIVRLLQPYYRALEFSGLCSTF